ncbi:coproporphyrinogen III oxidase [Sporodiniella umbellata]|nr:coproporphyrinogen III oxidase [Sporodiniella umbellata]
MRLFTTPKSLHSFANIQKRGEQRKEESRSEQPTSKCTYCNFNKYVQPKQPPNQRLMKAMRRELLYFLRHEKYGLKSKKIHSIYFGGGTPSLAEPTVIGSLLDVLDQEIGLDEKTEITLEANPTSVEHDQLKAFKAVGINRLSLGIQSFDDRDLQLLGRDHSTSDAFRALGAAKHLFPKVSFDLIYARPGQSLKGWQNELKEALGLAGDHLSMYQLTMEKSSPLHKQYKQGKLPDLPEAEIAAEMYEETIRLSQAAGFTQYEVSSYARGSKAISRHNFSYWQGMDYLGIGPGAHGRLSTSQGRVRTFGEFHPDQYMALCEKEGEGIRKIDPISFQTVAEELIMFGLRTRMGIPRTRFRQLTSKPLDDFIDQEQLALLIQHGFLIQEEKLRDVDMERFTPHELLTEWDQSGGIRPTQKGLECIDSILPRLLL